MEAIVAVYDDWGIGRGGTQPLTLSADRKRFRQMTAGACVIVGRKTLTDFPGGRPLPKRTNLVLSRRELPGVWTVRSPAEAAEAAADFERAFVIGGGQVYREMLPWCSRVWVTKIHAAPDSDTFFPNLDQDPAWELEARESEQTENGIRYCFCVYRRIEDKK